MSQKSLGIHSSQALGAEQLFDDWLARLSVALEARNGADFAALFVEDGYWRDILSFSWERPTFAGRKAIGDGFAATAALASPRNLRLALDRTAPRFARRSGRDVIEAWFAFDTAFGTGAGFARLINDSDQFDSDMPFRPRAWILLTTLQELRGFEDKVGVRRPSGEHFSKIESPVSWAQQRAREQEFADRDPEVLVVGAGQGGLILGARLRQMGVDALIIDKSERIGDVWRGRYNNLTLHNKLTANHFPYMPFPTSWPVWLPKDMLGDWLESYAKFMELNVWTSTELEAAHFDEGEQMWTVTVRLSGGDHRVMRVRHLVIATGVSGGLPKKPDMPGLSSFAGEVVHSGEFRTGMDYKGRSAIVIGTGNSGHDIAQDLYVSGAKSVSIMQRGPTCVLSLEPSAVISYSIYSDETPVEDTDLMVAALPHDMLLDSYKWITKKTDEYDRDLVGKLNAIGFKTHTGQDQTGFQLLYLRGAGGYYIDVGCAELLIDGDVGLVQYEDIERFVPDGLLMKDGRTIPLDLVVQATGFESMSEMVRRLLGDDVADRLGPVWGFDENDNIRNMWTRTPQQGLWLMGGAILEARLNSRFLALEIKASLEGLMPDRNSMPLNALASATRWEPVGD
ncbi:NAD(P)/FAD-dependent oxidoreductase [Sphingobium aquiterrae]|uniref:flavin-containing monooxygenase n=1 Tax=Sphingobium aquiterrae TaxID=2038656 RepID=UPI00301834C4